MVWLRGYGFKTVGVSPSVVTLLKKRRQQSEQQSSVASKPKRYKVSQKDSSSCSSSSLSSSSSSSLSSSLSSTSSGSSQTSSSSSSISSPTSSRSCLSPAALLSMYRHLLLSRKCFHYHTHGWYVLPDFDKATYRLSSRHYYHVHFAPSITRSGIPVCKCTCSAYKYHGSCQHIDVVRAEASEDARRGDDDDGGNEEGGEVIVVETFDSFRQISGSGSGSGSGGSGSNKNHAGTIVFSVALDPLSPPVIVISSICKGKRKYRCDARCCSSYCTYCQHCDAANEFMKINCQDADAEADADADVEEVEEVDAKVPKAQPQSISYESIPVPDFALFSSEKVRRKGEEKRYSTALKQSHRFDSSTILHPGVCGNKQCVSKLYVEDVTPKDMWNCKLYYDDEAVSVRVASCLSCRDCKQTTKYDGCEDRVFIYSKNILFSHHLLNEYTNRFSTQASSFQAFCHGIRNKYRASRCDDCIGNVQQCKLHLPFVNHKTFIKAWKNFTQLQPWKFEFSCPFCGPYPREVIVDGLTLAMPLSKCGNLRPPTWIDPSNNEVIDIPKNIGSSIRYIHNRTIRNLMMKFIGQMFSREKKPKPITADEYQQLIKLLDLAHLSGLRKTVELVKSFDLLIASSTGDSHLVSRRRICARLLRIVCSDEPLQQFVRNPKFFVELFSDLKQHWPLRRAEVMNYSPFVDEMLVTFQDSCSGCPEPILELMKQVSEKALSIETEITSKRSTPPASFELSQQDNIDDYTNTGCFYGLQKIRMRPNYSRDNCKEELKTTCDKHFETMKNLTGGAMVFWCKHRVCVGLHVIPKSEGRNDVFSGILTHWEKAPEVICYDYACQLMEYCITREPEFFKNTLFVVDRLHIHNHTKCSEAFDMRTYQRTGSSEFFNFEDNAAETGNCLLCRLRNSCKKMAPETYMRVVVLFLEIQNRRRIDVLDNVFKSKGSFAEALKMFDEDV